MSYVDFDQTYFAHAFGALSRVKLTDARQSEGLPVTHRNFGKGEITYCTFLPGLSYYAGAVPRRPVDRSSSAESMCHFIPTEFNRAIGALIASPAKKLTRPTDASEPLVETTIVESPQGVVIPAVNWSAGPVKGLKLTVNVKVPPAIATLASGAPLEIARDGERTTFTFDIDVADALILR
jgi:hypothetical protein